MSKSSNCVAYQIELMEGRKEGAADRPSIASQAQEGPPQTTLSNSTAPSTTSSATISDRIEELNAKLTKNFRTLHIKRHCDDDGIKEPIAASIKQGEADSSKYSLVQVLRCGRLIDGRSEWNDPERKGQCVIVVLTGNRITQVGWEGAVEVPKEAIVHDFSSHTVLPGLIDCHCHPFITSGENFQFEYFKNSSAGNALKGLKVLQSLLRAGWTSIRIAGDADRYYAQWDIRNAIREGMFLGPRLCGAGHYISITGGGGDNGALAPEHHCMHSDGKIVDGVESMRKTVREEIKYGSDWIKLIVSGAFMSTKDDPTKTQLTFDEVRTAVEEATRLGKHVMAHAHATEAIKVAVRAGVRSIEHGSFIDEEAARMMIERGTWLVPTQFIRWYYQQKASPTGPLAKMLELFETTSPVANDALKNAVKMGVKVALGTDWTGWDTSCNVLELKLLVEQLGLSPLEAIKAATSSAAELLDWSDQVGTIEAGKLADVLVVEGNPLEDITCLQKVTAVFVDGQQVPKTPRWF